VYEQAITDSNIWSQTLETAHDGPVQFAGDPRRIVSATREDSSPQVSPDGRRLAFISTRSGFEEVWTTDINGGNAAQVTQMRLPALGSPRWSPDSSRLSFDAVGPEGRAIYVIGAAGGAPRQWSSTRSPGRSSWSRDGRWLYFSEFDENRVRQLLRVSSTDPSQRNVLTSDGGFEGFESEDGSELYYVRDRERELRRMPAGGGPSTLINTGSPIAHGWWGVGQGGIYFVDMWDPALYSVPPISKGAKRVMFVDLKTGARRQIGTITGDLNGVFPDFCVAPDGKHIYFSVLEVSVSQIRMMEGGF
jgi:Tol biopolymer transport system component